MPFLRNTARLNASLVHHTGTMIRFVPSQLPHLPPGDTSCQVVLLDGQEVEGWFHRHPANPYIGGRALVGWIKAWVAWNQPMRVAVEQVGAGSTIRLRTLGRGPTVATPERTRLRKRALRIGRTKRRQRRRREYEELERDPRVRRALLQVWEPICQVVGCSFHLALPAGLKRAAVEVHHITHVSSGGSDSPVNLCLVCPNHHALIHRAPSSRVTALDTEHAEVEVDGLTLRIERDLEDVWELVDV